MEKVLLHDLNFKVQICTSDHGLLAKVLDQDGSYNSMSDGQSSEGFSSISLFLHCWYQGMWERDVEFIDVQLLNCCITAPHQVKFLVSKFIKKKQESTKKQTAYNIINISRSYNGN